jgi:hypothetical protein
MRTPENALLLISRSGLFIELISSMIDFILFIYSGMSSSSTACVLYHLIVTSNHVTRQVHLCDSGLSIDRRS